MQIENGSCIYLSLKNVVSIRMEEYRLILLNPEIPFFFHPPFAFLSQPLTIYLSRCSSPSGFFIRIYLIQM